MRKRISASACQSIVDDVGPSWAKGATSATEPSGTDATPEPLKKVGTGTVDDGKGRRGRRVTAESATSAPTARARGRRRGAARTPATTAARSSPTTRSTYTKRRTGRALPITGVASITRQGRGMRSEREQRQAGRGGQRPA